MTTADVVALLRRGMLALLLLGAAGLIGELVLLEHYEDPPQFVPFALLGATLAVGGWHAWDGGRHSLRALRVVMGLLLLAAPAGIYFHLTGNYTTEHDFDPSLLGLDLWLTVIRGEAPSLAPGTLAQFGLLGLLYSWRHPALGE
ncbi:MAG: hypothetical protein P3A32_01375 [Gemmatimonadota bacterium]|nr:hypothetical protein [Gemmatimonadota bacterium]MDQ8146533.1 hypothetical protein [Gemmatimonadota bacterium]MDQ8148458.1 hypothetical protein [Gemmatimonadota bacterium]MDQ8156634.1 hypothetical protein [Gemmatimonadota bacterium]MDQ8175887.1 hypothetical protein [Gemmatimonadota bacterium]